VVRECPIADPGPLASLLKGHEIASSRPAQLQVELMANSVAGDLIEGTGGLRKLRTNSRNFFHSCIRPLSSAESVSNTADRYLPCPVLN
jgi:hypothetical protein